MTSTPAVSLLTVEQNYNGAVVQFQKYYNSEDFSKILNYLSDKSHLAYLLLEAPKQIKKIFPDEVLELKVIYDPEIPNWEKLFIFIRTKLDADQAFDKLQQLDQTWWLDASDLAQNDLEIHIDFDEI